MHRMPGARLFIAAVALAVPLTGCGGSDDTGGQQNSSATSTAAAATPTEATSPEPGKLFTADPTIVGAHPIPFTSWSRLGADRIAINFQTGNPACYGVDATTTETGKAVTIELRSGSRADAVGRMCTMDAIFGTLEIQLKAPLGDRKVLSAA
ncbi:hypothetical protein [Nocardia sp. NPDC051832]|uniref:hypothetical protein n=1 Tax=Nocardia sp. NPDC051832 TaxID=3155673 RepID=UPI00342ADE2D